MPTGRTQWEAGGIGRAGYNSGPDLEQQGGHVEKNPAHEFALKDLELSSGEDGGRGRD